jgi:hypothetical protein
MSDKKQKRSPMNTPKELTQITVELPKPLNNRLAILSESHDGDVSKTIGEAIMLLWESRYPQQTTQHQNASAANALLPPDRQRALEMHNEGIPVEDIAKELDRSVEHIKEMLDIAVPSPDRRLLQKRARTMQSIGASLSSIAKQWNEQGIPTLSGHGRWHHAMIRKLLQE